MRPKKLILVLDPNAPRMSVTMFVLLTKGFRTIGVNTLDQAQEAIKAHSVDAILVPENDYENANRFTHSVVTAPSMTLTIERLRSAMYRKRGPKRAVYYVEQTKPVDTSAKLQNT